jgi:acyl phosphate:glycerol-3-phosphate acyltransferase
MMDPITFALAAASGCLIGAISSARIVSRIVAPGKLVADETTLRLDGTDKTMRLGTVSASSVSIQHGSRAGFITYVMDVAKVAVPVAIAWRAWPDWPYYLVVSVAAFAGHVWPVYYRFRGGRGLSAIYGSLLVIDRIGMLVTAIGGMLFGLVVARSVIVAYMAGVWFVLPWLWFRTHRADYAIYACVLILLFTIAILPEIREWRRIARDGTWSDPAAVMQLSGMGRGMIKMARRLGILKDGRSRGGPAA